MGEHQLQNLYLQHCIPGRNSDHSILVVRFVPVHLDYLVSLVFQGYQDDQEGPGCLPDLHRVDLQSHRLSANI